MKKLIKDIELANKSVDSKELKKLSKSSHYKVRRAVSRNLYTSQKVLKKLQLDPILNVAFMANKNAKKKISFKDSPSLSNPCVSCEENEAVFHLICKTCKKNHLSKAEKIYS
ncbi:MAG: hypothetical protein C0626_07470 [Arcobacter sp.]|uniref:hypothetical protein n=1 Tax=uncultured Arcobacter sp. TaxID=165434 RepID=UPI000CAAB43C|nr:hypothetical protein [uncultured Arcobacter sp.]PLY09901.1 MAG: hypothetical protein C0626_07470 [Arcobacter sp.]